MNHPCHICFNNSKDILHVRALIMARILKKNEDLFIFASIIELFFVREIICFSGFLSTDYMQMFEYESLYNTKMFGKTFHMRRWK